MDNIKDFEIPLLRLDFDENDIQFVQNGIAEILTSGYLTMDSKVKRFENLFSDFIGAEHSIGVNSGTSALEIILRSINVKGKSVVIPNITFMATPLAAIHAGANVIFADVLPSNLSIDPIDLSKKIRDDTVAVIPVHIGGIISSEWSDIEKICQESNLNTITPLWKINPKEYMDNLLNSNFKFILTSVSSDGLDEKWLGKVISTDDVSLLSKLSNKYGFNLNFEGGEAETFVTDCPIYSQPIKINKSQTIWDGYRGRFEIEDASLDSNAR